MFVLSEKRLREVIREEFERIMGVSRETDATIITSPTGADLIFPNPIRERFDNGEVESLKDII